MGMYVPSLQVRWRSIFGGMVGFIMVWGWSIMRGTSVFDLKCIKRVKKMGFFFAAITIFTYISDISSIFTIDMVSHSLHSTVRQQDMVFALGVITVSGFSMTKFDRSSVSWMGVFNSIGIIVNWWGMIMVDRFVVGNMVGGRANWAWANGSWA